MSKHFNGRIALDIRDSEPDWAPYLAPKAPDGSPNVLFIAWDDLGFATMDRGTFPFTGGTIDKVVVDVSGDRYIDHEAQVRAWFAID